MSDAFDVVVMGGGPGGSACGNFLSRAGMRVLVLEGERHPRHHIGESLLPGSVAILNRLGISSEEMARRYQQKYGARFYDPVGDRLVTFGFAATEGSVSPAYQVVREAFDGMLFEKAREAGCEMWEGVRIESFEEEAEVPVVRLRDGREVRGRFLVDATGRPAVIASKHRTKKMITSYGRVGVYNYFEDLPIHDELDPKYITMYLFEGGWVWLIPLSARVTSVGVVWRDVPVLDGPPTDGSTKQEAMFWKTVSTMPRLEGRLRGAKTLDEFRAIDDYSFTVGARFGERWAAVGDAGGFLDPIFSSGVHLALNSAEMASAGIVEMLRDGSDAGLKAYGDYMMRGFKVFQQFVHRFYNKGLVSNLFFAENKPQLMHDAITNVLAGYVWDEGNPVVRMMMGVGGE